MRCRGRQAFVPAKLMSTHPNHCGSLTTKNIRTITSDEVATVMRPLYAQSIVHGKLVRAYD